MTPGPASGSDATKATSLGAGRHVDAADTLVEPDLAETSVVPLTTHDGAAVTGVLRVPPGAHDVVTLMHPRQDVTFHALVPYLLRQGHAVWTQGSRSPNNDLNLIHEQAILDLAAGLDYLRQRDLGKVFCLGHSGGATLAAFYCEQAELPAIERLSRAPSGRPVKVPEASMPLPDGVVFFAPHPGQGALLQRVIDPSVVDEGDASSVDPDLDPFDERNGFLEAPESSAYEPEFVERYRAAQVDRVRRIDAIAADLNEQAQAANKRFKADGDPRDRRAALSPRLVLVHRTDADLRNVDLSLDPNRRPYGSLFGRRPDLTNSGLIGFGRLSTAEAWMSTWSATTTNADFARCAPGVTVPTLLLQATGDQASFPADTERFAGLLGADDLEVAAVDSTHFGGPIAKGEPTGNELAAARIGDWLAARV